MCDYMGSDGDGFGEKEIAERRETEKRISAKIFVCCNEVGEKTCFAITEETRLTSGGGRSGKEKGDGRTQGIG